MEDGYYDDEFELEGDAFAQDINKPDDDQHGGNPFESEGNRQDSEYMFDTFACLAPERLGNHSTEFVIPLDRQSERSDTLDTLSDYDKSSRSSSPRKHVKRESESDFESQAATKIQALARGKETRKQVGIKIGNMQTSSNQSQKKLPITLDSHLHRQKKPNYNDTTQAAAKIQAVARGKIAREKLKEKPIRSNTKSPTQDYYEDSFEDFDIDMSPNQRESQAKDHSKSQSRYASDKDAAAAKIQAVARGKRSRSALLGPKNGGKKQVVLTSHSKTVDLKARHDSEDYYEDSFEDTEIQSQKKSPITLDSHLHRQKKPNYNDTTQAAAKIQAVARGKIAREKLKEKPIRSNTKSPTQDYYEDSFEDFDINNNSEVVNTNLKEIERGNYTHATKIQAAFRGKASRKKIGKVKASMKANVTSSNGNEYGDYENDYEEEAFEDDKPSASNYNSNKLPSNPKTSSNNYQNHEVAATKIQALFRGNISRSSATDPEEINSKREESYINQSNEAFFSKLGVYGPEDNALVNKSGKNSNLRSGNNKNQPLTAAMIEKDDINSNNNTTTTTTTISKSKNNFAIESQSRKSQKPQQTASIDYLFESKNSSSDAQNSKTKSKIESDKTAGKKAGVSFFTEVPETYEPADKKKKQTAAIVGSDKSAKLSVNSKMVVEIDSKKQHGNNNSKSNSNNSSNSNSNRKNHQSGDSSSKPLKNEISKINNMALDSMLDQIIDDDDDDEEGSAKYSKSVSARAPQHSKEQSSKNYNFKNINTKKVTMNDDAVIMTTRSEPPLHVTNANANANMNAILDKDMKALILERLNTKKVRDKEVSESLQERKKLSYVEPSSHLPQINVAVSHSNNENNKYSNENSHIVLPKIPRKQKNLKHYYTSYAGYGAIKKPRKEMVADALVRKKEIWDLPSRRHDPAKGLFSTFEDYAARESRIEYYKCLRMMREKEKLKEIQEHQRNIKVTRKQKKIEQKLKQQLRVEIESSPMVKQLLPESPYRAHSVNSMSSSEDDDDTDIDIDIDGQEARSVGSGSQNSSDFSGGKKKKKKFAYLTDSRSRLKKNINKNSIDENYADGYHFNSSNSNDDDDGALDGDLYLDNGNQMGYYEDSEHYNINQEEGVGRGGDPALEHGDWKSLEISANIQSMYLINGSGGLINHFPLNRESDANLIDNDNNSLESTSYHHYDLYEASEGSENTHNQNSKGGAIVMKMHQEYDGYDDFFDDDEAEFVKIKEVMMLDESGSFILSNNVGALSGAVENGGQRTAENNRLVSDKEKSEKERLATIEAEKKASLEKAEREKQAKSEADRKVEETRIAAERAEKERLAKKLILKISNIAAKDLIDRGSFIDKQDPKIWLKIGDTVCETIRQKDAGTSAAFREDFLFEFDTVAYENSNIVLEVEAINEAKGGEDKDSLGKAFVKIKDIAPSKNVSRTFVANLSYKSPKGATAQGSVTMTGILLEKTVDKTLLSYNGDIELSINAINIKDLPDCNSLLDSQDPMVRITVGTEAFETRRQVDAGKDVTFAETFVFRFPAATYRASLQLKVEVLNKSLLGKESSIGSRVIPLKTILSSLNEYRPLRFVLGEGGEVSMSAKLTSSDASDTSSERTPRPPNSIQSSSNSQGNRPNSRPGRSLKVAGSD